MSKLTTYVIFFVNYKSGERVAEMEIKAVDYDTAQTIAEDMNTQFNVYVEEKE